MLDGKFQEHVNRYTRARRCFGQVFDKVRLRGLIKLPIALFY